MKRILLGATLLALAGVVATPAAWADPPPWAPAHGWRAKHRYVYYPNGEVYYEPATRAWFWLDGGSWRTGYALPAAFQAYVDIGGVNIELGTAQPYVEHTYVVEHYGGHPPGHWRGRHGDDDDQGWDDDDDHGHGHHHGHDHDHDH